MFCFFSDKPLKGAGGFFLGTFFLFSLPWAVKAQGEDSSAQTPALGLLGASQKADFSELAAEQEETEALALGEDGETLPEETVSSGGNDLTKSPTYQKFFLKPVTNRSPRLHHRKSGGFQSKPEHFGVSGHRRRHHPDMEQSHNAETRIGRKTLEHFVAGTNPLQALADSTPGASFSSGDPLSMDNYISTFYLRGYNQGQLGFTMDGIPMGDQTYGGGSNGIDVNQIEIQENIASVAASQGAGALDTPSSTQLGGAVAYTTLDPSDKFGVRISQQFGSFSSYRTFGRLDSGKLNKTGTKFQASFLRTAQNLWSGEGGGQGTETMNFKLVQPISHFGKITLSSRWADSAEYDALANTSHMLHSLGYGDHDFYPDYTKAKRWAAACHTGDMTGLPAGVSQNDACNVAYQVTQVQRNYLEGLRGEFQISPAITSNSLVYAQVSDGRYGNADPTLFSPGTGAGYPVNMAETDRHLKGRRFGVRQDFKFQLGHRHMLKTGIWYENNKFHQPHFFYGFQPDSGIPNDFNLKNKYGVPAYNEAYTTNTFQFYLEDKFEIARNMNFTYGFKSLVQTTNGGMISRTSDGVLDQWGVDRGAYRPAYGRLTASNAFLPHFNYDWKFLPRHEFYFDVAENMMPYTPGGAAWSAGLGSAEEGLGSAQAMFNEEKKNLRPSRTWNYVVGYRHSGKAFSFGIDYYHTDYFNRLGTIQAGSSNNQAVSSYLANLGGEKMDGMDLAGTAHLSKLFRLPHYFGQLDFTNSFSYNHAVYENSAVPTPNGPVNIKGCQQINYPRYMYKTNLNYVNGRMGWNLNVNYNSARNVTYTGDIRIKGYWTSEFTGYYLLGRRGREDRVKLSFGVSNLFGQRYTEMAGPTQLTSSPNRNDAGTPNLYWSAPRMFFGAVNVAF